MHGVGRTVGWVVSLLVTTLALTLLVHGALVVRQSPDEPQRRAEQAAFLEAALRDGAAARMQRLFPEGAAFQISLTALVVAADAARPVPARAHQLDDWLRSLDDPELAAPFRGSDAVFLRGWRLQVLLARHAVQPEDGIAARIREEVTALLGLVESSSTGALSSYAGEFWPVDSVVAMAGVARADRALGIPEARAVLGRWLRTVHGLRDPATGLIAHRVDAQGHLLDTARGSSSALILAFLPDLSPDLARADWLAFREHFVDRRAGLVGVREFPRGDQRTGDVDSGPLIQGISLSASAVALAGARRVGDVDLAVTLDDEADTFGMPLTIAGQRRHAGGVLPIGDAFVAWARTQPTAAGSVAEGAVTPLRPAWWAWAGGLGVLVLILGAASVRLRPGRRARLGSRQRAKEEGHPAGPEPQADQTRTEKVVQG